MSIIGELESVLCEEPDEGAVSFRPMDVYDAERIHRWLESEETFEALHWRPRSLEETQLRIEMWMASEDAVHLMVLWHGEPSGFIHLEHFDPHRRQLWLTLIVVDPACVGKGIGTRAMTLLVGRLRALPFVDRVMLAVDATNAPALTVYSRVGFERIDSRIQHFPDGPRVEQYIMELDLRK